MELTAPVAEIEVRGGNNFILREQGSNDWRIVGEKYPADAGNVQLFINSLASLRIAEFVKDVATKTDWADHGLAAPQREIILRSKAGDTNAVIARLSFGAARTNEVFAQCAGEDSIYAVTLRGFQPAPGGGLGVPRPAHLEFQNGGRGANHDSSSRQNPPNRPQRAGQMVAGRRLEWHPG